MLKSIVIKGIIVNLITATGIEYPRLHVGSLKGSESVDILGGFLFLKVNVPDFKSAVTPSCIIL